MVFAIACQKESQPAQGESKTHRDFEKTSTTIDKKNFELFELELTQVGCSLKPLGVSAGFKYKGRIELFG